jgi:hypothetical protein
LRCSKGLRMQVVLQAGAALLLFSAGAIAPACAQAGVDSSCSGSCGSFSSCWLPVAKQTELC